jgi:hypothetical protein
MLTKVYLYTWLVLGAAFLLLFVAGSMNLNSLVIFGFIAFGMIFIGMIAVLPFIASHPTEKTAPEASRVLPEPVKASIQHGAHSVRA